jgi:hypothetical protein
MPQYEITSGLPSYPAGLSDKDAALVLPLYRSVNSLAQYLSFNTGNVTYEPSEQAQASQLTKLLDAKTQKIFVKAGEALSYGNMLSLTVSGGKIVAYKADATNLARPALAVCDTPGGIALDGYGEAVFMQGRTIGIAGTTFGTAYYLSTAGAIQSTPPVATGVLNQIVGVGLGSEGFYLNVEAIGRRPVLIYKFNATTLRVLYSDGTYVDNAV